VSAGTDPTHPDTPAPGTWPAPSTWVVVLGLVLLAGVAILAAFAFARQSGRPAVVGRLRRLGAALGRHESDADDGASGDAEPTTEPPPIPTNRGRVLELLQEHGGRMLQSDIVEQTDWSKSKVSRVLSDMDEAGEVAKIDVGRGNLIALPEVAPPGARPRSKREEE